MSEEHSEDPTMVVKSSRFGDLTVPVDSIIELPTGLIGFSRTQRFIMIEHKPPFAWLQSIDEPELAFVIVDGGEFGEEYVIEPPYGDKDIDLQADDDFAVLVIITVRPNPKETTANLKAPVFVNLRNKKGVQVIFDHPALSTRFPLWAQDSQEGQELGSATDSMEVHASPSSRKASSDDQD